MNPTVKLTNSQEVVFSNSYIVPISESEISLDFKEYDFLVKFIFEENSDEKTVESKVEFLDCGDKEAFFKVIYGSKRINIGLLKRTFNLFHIESKSAKDDTKKTKTQYKVNFNIEKKASAAFLLHFQLVKSPSIVLEASDE